MMLNLLAEPSGEEYRALVKAARVACEEALLVVRRGVPMSHDGEALLGRLKPFTLRVDECSEWPGTTLLQDTATVHRFRFSEQCAELLCGAARGLYSWLQPDLPEDLCLIRPGGDVWLVSISHEKDAYLELTPDESRVLLETIPSLKLSYDAG
jgi:hypothetical protein